MVDWFDEATKPQRSPAASVDWTDEALGGTEPLETSAQPEPGVLSQAGDFVKGAATSVRDLFTGDKRREFELPGLIDLTGKEGFSFLELTRIAGAFAITPDERAIADVVKEIKPEAEISEDSFGNVIVGLGDKRFYVNPPGLDRTDIGQFLGQAAAFRPTAGFGAKGKSLPRRMARTATAATATSAGLDVGAGLLGSEQGVDPVRAAITGVGGAVFEGLAPLAKRTLRAIFGQPQFFNSATRQFTDRGRKAAEAAGLDVDDISEKLGQGFAREARDATDPADLLAAGRKAQAGEFDIRLSRGQATEDFEQLAREEATRKGVFGEDAGNILRQFDKEQAGDIARASENIQGRFAGGARTIERETEGAIVVAEGLTKRADELSERIADAYQEAGQREARFSGDSLSGLLRAVKKGVEDFGLDAELHPAAVKSLRSLARLAKKVRLSRKLSELAGTGSVRGLNKVGLRAFETERRKLIQRINAAKNPSDRAAIIRIKAALDEWLEDAVDMALFEGDDDALKLLKQARSLRREFGQKFQGSGRDDEVGKVIQKILNTNPTAEQVVNYVFGLGKLGGRLVSAKVVGRLKTIFGADSDEFSTLREMAWVRITTVKGKAASPRVVQNQINDAMIRSPTIMNELYTAEEQAMMKRFARAAKLTSTPDNVMNQSQTAFTLARLIRQFLRRGGTMATFRGKPGLGAALFGAARVPLPGTAAAFARRGARKATSPRAPRPSAPALVAPAIAGVRLSNESP